MRIAASCAPTSIRSCWDRSCSRKPHNPPGRRRQIGNRNSSSTEPGAGRRFGLLVGGVFLVFGGLSWWRGHNSVPYALWALGGVLVLGGALFPGSMGPLYRAWMGLARVLSKVTTPIFMGIVYFLVLGPIGLIRRVFGKNSLVRAPG